MADRSPLHRWFLDHPRSVDETYIEHMGVASRFGATMIAGGIACMIHGLVPAWFSRTGSSTVKSLYDQLKARQPGAPRAAYHQPDWRPEYEI